MQISSSLFSGLCLLKNNSQSKYCSNITHYQPESLQCPWEERSTPTYYTKGDFYSHGIPVIKQKIKDQEINTLILDMDLNFTIPYPPRPRQVSTTKSLAMKMINWMSVNFAQKLRLFRSKSLIKGFLTSGKANEISELLKCCKDNNVKVIFVTNNPSINHVRHIANLINQAEPKEQKYSIKVLNDEYNTGQTIDFNNHSPLIWDAQKPTVNEQLQNLLNQLEDQRKILVLGDSNKDSELANSLSTQSYSAKSLIVQPLIFPPLKWILQVYRSIFTINFKESEEVRIS